MAVRKCENGHLFDDELHSSCPYCLNGGNRIDFVQTASMEKPVTDTRPNSASPDRGDPRAEAAAHDRAVTAEDDRKRTLGIYRSDMYRDPVVGWLVCIEGPEKGSDYRLYAMNNIIGSGPQCDIRLQGDDSVSPENHARLSYDSRHNVFHIISGGVTKPVYLNGEPVRSSARLRAHDNIGIGCFTLRFVPFCGEDFQWLSDGKGNEK